MKYLLDKNKDKRGSKKLESNHEKCLVIIRSDIWHFNRWRYKKSNT